MANKFIMHNDRELYSPLFAAIEQYCIERDIILGGVVGIDLLQKMPLSRDSFYWEIYTTNVFEVAKDMIDHLYTIKLNHIDKRTLFLRTELRHREISIHINARILCSVRTISNYKSSKVQIQPTLVDGYFGGKIYCVPEEMQIIEIYRGLYTPDKVKQWPKLLVQESSLFDLIDANLAAKIITGGKSQVQQVQEIRSLEKITSAFILVGDFALGALLGPAKNEPHKLQIIADDIGSVIKPLKSIYGNDVHFTKIQLPLLDDFRLIKYVVYANGKALLEVFNSTEYELIPFRKIAGLRVASYYVLLRFMMIDIWALRLLASTKTIQLNVMIKRVNVILEQAREIRAMVSLESPDKLFQVNNYDGVVVKDGIAKKKLRELETQRFSNYYPAIKAEREPSSS